MTCSRPNRSMALVISCACVAMALCAAVPAALASDPPRVADLSFTVSDPLDSSLLDNSSIDISYSTGPHWLNEDGFVVLTTQNQSVYVWDSQSGSGALQQVHGTLPHLLSYSINRYGSLSCTEWDNAVGNIGARFDLLPDGSYVETGLIDPRGHIQFGASAISDVGWVVGFEGYSGENSALWTPAGSPDWIAGGQLHDVDNQGNAVGTVMNGGVQPVKWIFFDTSFTYLPKPPWAALGFADDINGRGVAAGFVTDSGGGGTVIRWPTDSTYDLLPFPNEGDGVMYSPSIADNGIIVAQIFDSVRGAGYGSLWVWDPVSLEPFYLDDLVDPAGNPQGYEFHWNTPVYGTASNAAYTRILAVGYQLVANNHDYVVLTAITRGLTKDADFESKYTAAFDPTGRVLISDDPYTPGNHVLELDGASSVSQPVSMLETPHDLVFKAHANQAAGILTVRIDGQVVGTFRGDGLTQQSMKLLSINLTQPSLLGKDGVTLEFSWRANDGQQILIDDIDFGKGGLQGGPTVDRLH